MAKYIQAFFKTEDDAETVKADLAKVNTNNVRVDHLPEDTNTLFLAPLAYTGSNASSVGSGGYIPAFSINNDQEADDSPRRYTIEFEVADEDFEKALKFIMDSDGYVDKETIEL